MPIDSSASGGRKAKLGWRGLRKQYVTLRTNKASIKRVASISPLEVGGGGANNTFAPPTKNI